MPHSLWMVAQMTWYFRSDQDEKKRSGSSVSFDKEAIAKNRGSVRLQSGELASNKSYYITHRKFRSLWIRYGTGFDRFKCKFGQTSRFFPQSKICKYPLTQILHSKWLQSLTNCQNLTIFLSKSELFMAFFVNLLAWLLMSMHGID